MLHGTRCSLCHTGLSCSVLGAACAHGASSRRHLHKPSSPLPPAGLCGSPGQAGGVAGLRSGSRAQLGLQHPWVLPKSPCVERCGSQGGSEATTSFLSPGGHGTPATELLPGSRAQRAGLRGPAGRFQMVHSCTCFCFYCISCPHGKIGRFQAEIQNSSFFDKLRNSASLCPLY